ncbi:mitochondrial splicing suppressor protein 51 [Geosmithia morbida]|uniref:Mitochondrial splicing suppressor protein 51 n=1 Tax=Geosmithia morbida TaxID=1094350 RepID=A0A9P4YSG1_9HYPO|nr:mitochondrial splicing suppressor protein 51 [Geosmithia morbida]KAF4121225.1 mitochondrial splicing suppressor protein 51 [Geosmithia morbida]
MEPSLRRAASSLCGRCSASLRRQSAARHVTARTIFAIATVHHARGFHSTIPKHSDSLKRDFTTTAKAESAAAAAATAKSQPETPPLRLAENDLFHPFSTSPVAEFRDRAAFMKQHAYCPHPHHEHTRVPTTASNAEAAATNSGTEPPAHVDFECPDCGLAVYCSKEHWMDDYENHLKVCDTLRQINEDDHDLRSGRIFTEGIMPTQQLDEASVNMTNWDTFMYTREFDAVNSDRSMRQITRLLTYPVTIGSVLHELSPYSMKDGERLTAEGLKSFSALRYSLHQPKSGSGAGVNQLKPEAPPVRIFILGARAESSLPRSTWTQLAYMFPQARFHLIFIGPESMANRDDEFPLPERTPSNPWGAVVEDRISHRMKISTIVDYYHTIHKTGYFAPYDPYFDCFVLFHPGLGHPASSHEWEETLPQLLETKVPIISTGYTQSDLERDVGWVKKTSNGEFDVLLEPGENKFRSLRWDLNDMDPQDISCGNWGVWAFRGKRYVPVHSVLPMIYRLSLDGGPNVNPNTTTASLPNYDDKSRELPPPMATTAPPATAPAAAPLRPKSTTGHRHRRGRSSHTAGGAGAGAGNNSNASSSTSDPLSDRVTTSLIRRTLCPSDNKIRDGSSSDIHDVLPPLTSRNDVDLQLYALVAIILRDFVQSWYGRITTDEAFVAEIVHIVAHCTRAIEQRLRKVDLESLLLDEIPDLVERHMVAYRASRHPVANAPVQVDTRQAYHCLFPLPALSPVPIPEEEKSVEEQKRNETVYRQLLVQAVLAVLLPTEDLENGCLTTLVGQILSDLIIGNLVAEKLAQPWMMWEMIVILARVVNQRRDPAAAPSASRVKFPSQNSNDKPANSSSTHTFFLSLINLGIFVFSLIRLLVTTIVDSSSLPSRFSSPGARDKDRKQKQKLPEAAIAGEPTTDHSSLAPILDFRVWSCIATLIELPPRMPWLHGLLSLMQYAVVNGPGRIGGLDSTIDR